MKTKLTSVDDRDDNRLHNKENAFLQVDEMGMWMGFYSAIKIWFVREFEFS